MTELKERYDQAHCLDHLSGFRRRLLSWYDRHQRDLPWRKQVSAYRVWVSEIMLQQTQVKTVLGYFDRFMEQFPTIQDLAKADVEQVLKAWEGLGYYRRARQMHAAARVVVDRHDGTFPTSYEEVIGLPGIGRYTAGAILSIVHGQRLPILEGNTVRLFARLLFMQDDPRDRLPQKDLWQFAEAVLPKRRTGDFNQALMELGAVVCTPRSPTCCSCPVSDWCPTRIQHRQQEIPNLPSRIKYTEIQEAIVLVKRRGKYLVRQCRDGERWAGLWDFPRYPLSEPTAEQELQRLIQSDHGLVTRIESANVTIKHAVTKYRITLQCFQTSDVSGRLCQRRFVRWASSADIADLPMSVTGRKVANQFLPKN